MLQSVLCLSIVAAFSIAGGFFRQANAQDCTSVVVAAFESMHNGWSSDEVVLQDDLYAAFLDSCRRQLPDTSDETFAWALLNARKAGKLAELASSKRRRIAPETPRHVAEMAARFMEDKHKVSMDRIVCSPVLRAEFDAVAKKMAPGSDSYDLRKSAFGLRKARRLKPELVLRIADWQREVITFSLPELLLGKTNVPEKPGVYLFRDGSGYLYIGESHDLSDRVAQHLDASEEASLLNLFRQHSLDENAITLEVHAFGRETKARETRVRRAYESELIASRSPRFNIRP